MREETKYLVGITGDTATMAVIGKANYLNCRNVGEFFSTAIERGCRKIVVDCSQCNGMDSTFLGMVAGAALKIHKTGGEMVLLNLNDRNMELIDNLGIYKLVSVDGGQIRNAEAVGGISPCEQRNPREYSQRARKPRRGGFLQ